MNLMANLIHKSYELRTTKDELVCVAILQFPEDTNVKHWERIAGKINELFNDPIHVTHKENWNYHDLVLIVSQYVEQHFESGFSILFHWKGDADYIIRI